MCNNNSILIMKEIIVNLKTSLNVSSLETPVIGNTKKLVNLYPITDNEKIPEEALNPEIWDIPEGYYAIEKIN